MPDRHSWQQTAAVYINICIQTAMNEKDKKATNNLIHALYSFFFWKAWFWLKDVVRRSVLYLLFVFFLIPINNLRYVWT